MLSSKKHIRLQFARLKRHHEQALKNRDEIAFLDLAHCLRIWSELKSDVDELISASKGKVKFKNPVRTKAEKKITRQGRTLTIFLATGVKSPDVEVKNFRHFDRALTPEEVRKLYEAGPPQAQSTDLTYTEWLGSSVIEMPSREGEESLVSLSREILIKRVANTLGASHPQGLEDGSEMENRFDAYIAELNGLEIAGYPANYYQLLEIAADILTTLKLSLEDQA
jgi:hypothetical protein